MSQSDVNFQYNIRILGLDITIDEFRKNQSKVYEAYHRLIHRWTPPEELSTSVFVDMKQYEDKRNQITKAYNELLLSIPASTSAPVPAPVPASIPASASTSAPAPVPTVPDVVKLSQQNSPVYYHSPIQPIIYIQPQPKNNANANTMLYYMKMF